MGVRREFYAPFAQFLADNGMHVLTFDYRGMGGSRRGSLRGFECDIGTWVDEDLASMLIEARKAAPELPLLYVGHSLGGQVLGVTPGRESVSAALTVNSGSGYYRLNDRISLRVRLLWFFMFPVLTPIFGYFPGKRLRMVGDLPKGVAYQWRRWCLHPEYLLAEGSEWRARMAQFRAPILRYSFSDDELINERAIESLHSFYSGSRIERRHIAPGDIGAARIGHFGFFQARNRAKLWVPAFEWLLNAASRGRDGNARTATA
jgi:predicted alpha/beta hydrolase